MGYFKSSLYPLNFSRIILTKALDVSTPSATSVVESKISSIVSPFPNRYPNLRFRDSGPKHVPNVSPTPDNPDIVLGLAPIANPSLLISAQPLVTKPLIAFVPNPSPSHIPADNAITFFTAPPISTPITSLLVNTLKFSPVNKSAKSSAKSKSSDATTTAVATPSQISLANDGPDKNAYDLSSPKQSLNISFINPRLDVSMPFDALSTGVPPGICSLIDIKKSRLY
mmetsp:Transcript_19584/g.26886  ORF Transcript_19584/g.26886 Transcript_19584/m.26886 type:complete len:226 (-) Transcript_19584:720-1397(-)